MSILQIIEIFKAFGSNAFIIKYLGNFVNQDYLLKILSIVKKIGGSENLEEAIKNIGKDHSLESKFANAVARAEISYFKDKDSARKRDIELNKFGKNSRANYMLIFAFFGMIFCILSIVFFKNFLGPELVAIISAAIGVFAACLKEAFFFEFGSNMRNNNDFRSGFDIFKK